MALAVADWGSVLSNGHVRLEGTASELASNHELMVESYLGVRTESDRS